MEEEEAKLDLLSRGMNGRADPRHPHTHCLRASSMVPTTLRAAKLAVDNQRSNGNHWKEVCHPGMWPGEDASLLQPPLLPGLTLGQWC